MSLARFAVLTLGVLTTPSWGHFNGYPMEEPLVTGTFMEHRPPGSRLGAHFHGGLDLISAAGNMIVRPVANGTLYYDYERTSPDTVYKFWIVHPANGGTDYDGLATRYLHIGEYPGRRRGLHKPKVPRAITTADTLGTIVTPTNENRDHLHFEVRVGDNLENATYSNLDDADYINPLRKLPPITDRAIDYATTDGGNPWTWTVETRDRTEQYDVTASESETVSVPKTDLRFLFEGFDRVNRASGRTAFYSLRSHFIKSGVLQSGEAFSDTLLKYRFTADQFPADLWLRPEYLFDTQRSTISEYHYRLFAHEDANRLSISLTDGQGQPADPDSVDRDDGYIDGVAYGLSSAHSVEVVVGDHADNTPVSKKLVFSATAIGDRFSDLRAAAGSRRVTLSWYGFRAGSWTGYQVQRSQDSGVSYTTIATVPYDETSEDGLYEYIDNTATQGLTYYYKIFTDELYGPVSARPSNTDAPSRPGTPVISLGETGAGYFVLNVTTGADGADSYAVEYGPADQSFPWSATFSGTETTTVSDNSLVLGTYKVRVQGKNTTGTGSYSNVVRFTLNAPAKPATPTGTVAAVRPGSDRGWVLLNWARNSEPDIAGYQVFCFDGTEYQRVDETAGLAWSSLGADIWPTDAEIGDGRYALHADGSGTNLQTDPHQVYTNSPSSTYNDSISYWFAIKAKNRQGNLSELSDALRVTLPGASGRLAVDESWAGFVRVGGDVTVPDGVTLTLAAGTVVQVAPGADATAGGTDASRAEIIVEDGGTLTAVVGTATADSIVFRSASDPPSASDWYGIRVARGGTATLTGVTVRDGVHCAKASRGGTLTSENLTLADCGTPPMVTGPAAAAFAEHGTGRVARYTATDAEGDAVTWSLAAGHDAATFTIDRGGRLRFGRPPDFSSPTDAGHATDADGNNVYHVTVRARDSQQASTDALVTVRVTPVPTVQAVAGHEQVTLRWEDPGDGAITGWQYRMRRAEREAAWGQWRSAGTGATTTEYTVTRDLTNGVDLSNGVKYLFQVRAVIGLAVLGLGSVEGAASSTVGAVPSGLRATAYNGAVGLAWVDPQVAGLSGWRTRHRRLPDGAWSPYTGLADGAGTHVVRNLTNDEKYRFEVQGLNAAGEVLDPCPWNVVRPCTWQVEATPEASLPLPPNEAPSKPSGPPAVSVDEGVTDTQADYTSIDPEGTAIQWSLTGADADSLSISSQGRLSFRNPPDYEAPGDQDKDRVYEVEVVASDAALSSPPLAVAVTVGNVDEPGAVGLSLASSPETPLAGPAQVGQRLQATLSDPDRVVMIQGWQWQRQPAGGEFADVPDSISATYGVTSADVCGRLRATVDYRDGHGSAKMVEAPEETEPVIDKPGAPENLSPTEGDGQVSLSWDAAPDHCSSITRYESRYYPEDPRETNKQWSPWTEAPADEDGTPPEVRARTVPGLANDTEYTLEVRAVNGVDGGVAAAVTATPRGCVATVAGPDSVRVREEAPADSVIATFTVSDCDGSTVTASRWEISGADAETRRDTLQIDASGQVSFKHRGPDYENPTDQDRDHDHEVQVRAQVGGRWSAPHALVVVVENIDDPGRVTITPSPPRVGRPVAAQLVDEDGLADNTDKTWSWSRATGDGSRGPRHHTPSVILSRSPEYTPTASDAGHRLEVTVTYDDAHGPGKTATGQSALPVRGVAPGPPKDLAAAPGDGQVRLTWSAADDSGSAIEYYELDRGSGDWTKVPPEDHTARDTTVAGLSNGTAYTFRVRAHNAEGDGPPALVTATPCLASVGGPGSVRVREEAPADSVIASFTVTDCDGSTVTASRWEISGADAETRRDTLQIDASGQVSFKHRGPDYENPTDQDRDHDHEVQVRAQVGGRWSAPHALVVVVENIDDPGRVTITPSPPRVGRPVAAQLVDEDGLADNTDKTWSWSRATGDGSRGPRHHTPSVILSRSPEYTPTASDAGHRLEVTVTYDDAHGPGKTATGQSALPVRGVAPGPPKDLAAAPGDGQVRLTWSAADDSGSAIEYYELDRGSGDWTKVPPEDHTARDTTVAGLSNGTAYTFRVRAHNAEGDGPPALVTATPATEPGTPALSADPGYRQVVLTWTAAAANGAAVDRYEYRYRSGASWSGRSWHTVAGGGGARTVTVSSLTNGTEYTFQVRAHNAKGDGDADTERATPVNRAPSVSGPATPTVPERTKLVDSYSGSDPDPGDAISWLLGDTDASHFELKTAAVMPGSRRELHFKNNPDFDGRRSYSVRVRVRDREGAEGSVQVAVSVSDVDEPGFVTVTPSSPRVGDTVTATLTDTDAGVNDTTWTWTREGSQAARGFSQRSSRRPVTAADVGYRLRVTVTYDDNQGDGKSATARTNAVQAAKPGAPGNLRASTSSGQVSLSWTAAATNGATIQYYQVRRGSGSWSTVSGGGNARSQTVTGLTNGTQYTFYVRAHNSAGDGPSASIKATPAGKPGAPKNLSAQRRDRQAKLTWNAADNNGSEITHYEYRRMQEGGASRGAAWSSWSTVSGGADADSLRATGLTNGTQYTWEVRAENGKGEGPAASVSVTPAGKPGAPKSLATARPGPNQASISWEAADANGSAITRYQYRRRVGTTGTWRGWFTVSGGGSARSRTVSGLSDNTAYTWEVRAENGVGFGSAASIYQPVAGPGGNRRGEPDNIGDDEGEPDTPMAKPVAAGLDRPDAPTVLAAPNPFNAGTTLRVHLPQAGPVTLTVYNTAGQVVARLEREVWLAAGTHVREWHGTDERGRPAASGLYLYQLIASGQVRVGKLALIR